MIDQQGLSVTSWVSLLQSDDLLALLIACTPDSLPPLSSYYDFMNRLWGRDVALDHADQSKLYALIAVVPSMNLGLICSDYVIVAGIVASELGFMVILFMLFLPAIQQLKQILLCFFVLFLLNLMIM